MDKLDFLRRANIVHSGKYDYSDVVYKNAYEKVTIVCPDHGKFEQKPYNHIRGAVCLKCAIVNRAKQFKLPLEKFIEKAKDVHGNKYDYSEVQYLNNRDLIDIKCQKHGKFQQRVSAHLQGYGCVDCSNEKRTYTTEKFVTKANVVHNGKYDYSKVIYRHSQTKVVIICPKHAEFRQLPNLHLLGSGCPVCANNERKLVKEEFIFKAVAQHGDKYDYSNVIYKGCREKIIITCREHGNFEQTPNSHLNGAGCPYCNSSKGERVLETIFNNNGISYIREYKLPEIISRREYDFYLPDHNLLIEFQGIQHYKPIDYFGGEDALNYTKQNDRLKRSFAKLFKYRLLEFNYKQLKLLSNSEFEELVLSAINRL